MNSIGWLSARLVDDPDGPVLVDDRGTLARWRIAQLRVSEGAVAAPAATAWEIDEVTQTLVADSVRVTLRHSIDQTWSLRILVHNTGDVPIRLNRLALAVDTGPDWTAWAACDGAEAMVTVLPHGPGRLLGFTVLQGELRRDGAQLVIDDLLLAPGAQHVVRIRGDWYASGSELARHRPTAVPAREWWEVGTVVELDHPDQALVASRAIPDDEELAPYEGELTSYDGELTSYDGARVTELDPGRPGRIIIELAGPRGRCEVAAGFAPGLADLVAIFLEHAERRWPTGRQGLRIDSVADGVILQHHDRFGDRGPIRYDDGHDALDGLVERMADEGPLAVALLAEQALRTGDPVLAERASVALSTLGPDPARMVVMLPVMAARAMTGLDPTPPPPAASAAPASPQLSGSHPLTTLLAAAVTDPHQRETAMRQLGAHWGLGLHGQRLELADLVEDARLLALASLLGQFDPPQPSGWVLEWEELITREHCRLRGELWLRLAADPETVAPGLAWLLLAP